MNLFATLAVLAAFPQSDADWPQFMRDSAHTGNAAGEELKLPLGLAARVKLGDAILTSPAVVAGRVYVVDQMGTAYAVDPKAGRILWKTSPEGDRPLGSNTSSPCVVQGKMYFGTMAGNLHILNAQDGKVVKTVPIGSPIVGAVTAANDSIYVQALDSVIRCLTLDGAPRWTWDHYARYNEEDGSKRGHPGGWSRPHYGGRDCAVSGRRLVTTVGWDILALDDNGSDATLAWCRRCPNGRDSWTPLTVSISGESVFSSGQGADGVTGMSRFSLKDGSRTALGSETAYTWLTPAARGSAAVMRTANLPTDHISLFDFDAKKAVPLWRDPKAGTTLLGSPALARSHAVLTTLEGEVIVSDLASGSPPSTFKTPQAKGLASPAISCGCIYVGGDDGHLYVLAPGGTLQAAKDEKFSLNEPRSKPASPTGKTYGWITERGDMSNTCAVDDPGLKGAMRLRWAARCFGNITTPCIATAEGDVITVTFDRTVSCLEQNTGRLRWRLRLPPESPNQRASAGLLAAEGRLYAPCPNSPSGGQLICLDLRDGKVLWSAPIGTTFIWSRQSPKLAGGKIVFATTRQGVSTLEAWDAATGAPAWKVELNVTPASSGESCTDGEVVYYTVGHGKWQWKGDGKRKRGETVAVKAKTGEVLWRTDEFFGTGAPVVIGGKVLMNETEAGVTCLEAATGKLMYKVPKGENRISIGPDFFVLRGYGGYAQKFDLKDGKPSAGLQKGGHLGGEAHGCGPVVLTSGGLSINVTVAGLHVRDTQTGALLWQSPGFAPRGCANPAVSNGRVFYSAAANGMLYCWEPQNQ